MNKISVLSLDLAKNLFQVHGVNETGEVMVRKQLTRSQASRYFARIPPCLNGMEACGGAHYWARTLAELGHTVRLMAPAFVKPYLKSNKNDRPEQPGFCWPETKPGVRHILFEWMRRIETD
jgi:transposase